MWRTRGLGAREVDDDQTLDGMPRREVTKISADGLNRFEVRVDDTGSARADARPGPSGDARSNLTLHLLESVPEPLDDTVDPAGRQYLGGGLGQRDRTHLVSAENEARQGCEFGLGERASLRDQTVHACQTADHRGVPRDRDGADAAACPENPNSDALQWA